MTPIRVLILRAAGTNCDWEACHAWELAGARPERVHLRRLIERPALLDDYQILTIPGGFSYGDDISAGRIFAAQLERELLDEIRRFIDADKLVLGICNGFQILVKAGLLPFPKQSGPRVCTITYNEPPGFQDRWVCLQAATDRCVFLEKGRRYEMPIAHGEGRVLFADEETRRRVARDDLAALRYVPLDAGNGLPQNAAGGSTGMAAPPHNPNGSADDLAGLCDETGRVLGLMPHPDRFTEGTQHPCWTARPPRAAGDGLAIFQRATQYFS